jgi:hypothetical protein
MYLFCKGGRYVPGLDKVPVRQMLRLIFGISRARPVHQVQIDIVNTQILERRLNALLNLVVPGVVKLGGEPDLFAGHARVANTSTNFGFVAVGQSCVNVAVTLQQGVLYSLTDLIGLGLPSSQTNSGDLVTGVEGVCLPGRGRGDGLAMDRVSEG